MFAAFSMTIPYLIVANLLGPEFPSMFGGLIGLAIVISAARKGFLVPERESAWDFDSKENWDEEWTGCSAIAPRTPKETLMPLVRAWAPYLLVALLLVITVALAGPGTIPPAQVVTLSW